MTALFTSMQAQKGIEFIGMRVAKEDYFTQMVIIEVKISLGNKSLMRLIKPTQQQQGHGQGLQYIDSEGQNQ